MAKTNKDRNLKKNYKCPKGIIHYPSNMKQNLPLLLKREMHQINKVKAKNSSVKQKRKDGIKI